MHKCEFVLLVGVATLAIGSAPTWAIGPEVPIVNSGAEDGMASSDGQAAVSIPGWSVTGTPTVVEYGTSGPFPPRDVGIPETQQQLFVGGPSPGLSTLSQSALIPLEALWCIDAGQCGISAVARLGGWETATDSAKVVVEVLDEQEVILATLVIGPVTAADRGGVTSLMERSDIRGIPPGARAIHIRVELYGVDGPYNNAFADDIHVTIELPDPVQPATWSRIKVGEGWGLPATP